MMTRKISLTILTLILVLVGYPVAGQRVQRAASKAHAYIQGATKPANSKSLEGEWNGTLEAGGQKLRLLLKITKSSADKLTGTIDSLDQGANDIPISSVEQKGDQVKLELSGIGASYQGKMNAESLEITGEWQQGGGSFPLVFRRSGSKDSQDKKTPDRKSVV